MNVSAVDRGVGLPDWHELLAAFVGATAASRHPITVWACELGALYRKSCPQHPVVAIRRMELIGAIDGWAARYLRRSSSAKSVGAHVDRMAAATARALRALRVCESVGDREHAAWTAAAALADEWADIVSGMPPRRYGGPGAHGW
ncbi:hypothetical protein BJY24_005755 [Nocardia transvalensis]|uniref:DUF4254 domain-containing protein n=1 Tax=Nocardia transvalensis TaxID=37333 RepID=A0A7W9PJG2_9NOCA|nr:hypothetical protein [Nocardia transvalensis]MBB5916843.1 hypothetical protein [Nocardia transvalensis]